MNKRWSSVSDPSPIWNLHAALWTYAAQEESRGRKIDEDLCAVISVDMHSYMVRNYGIQSFTIRGIPVIAENMCPSTRISFLSRSGYNKVKGNASYWK